ncbi:MAG: hypothetical protein V1914_03965 [archaeon]
MQQTVKKDILSALGEAYLAFAKFDLAKLKRISNFTIHNAGIFQDAESIKFALLIYSLAKVSAKEREMDYPKWKQFTADMLRLLKEARRQLGKGDEKTYTLTLKKMFQIIGKLDKKLTTYATEVIEQAKIKKGSKVYEHGISAGRAAELMRISLWELQSYVGGTAISEKTKTQVSATERIKNAKRIFKIK